MQENQNYINGSFGRTLILLGKKFNIQKVYLKKNTSCTCMSNMRIIYMSQDTSINTLITPRAARVGLNSIRYGNFFPLPPYQTPSQAHPALQPPIQWEHAGAFFFPKKEEPRSTHSPSPSTKPNNIHSSTSTPYNSSWCSNE